MKRWTSEHPYALATTVFLVIVVVGWRFLGWRDENFAFLLLLYFLVTLGIRLDDISRKLGRETEDSSGNDAGKDAIISQLQDIQASLASLNASLHKLLEKTDPPPD